MEMEMDIEQELLFMSLVMLLGKEGRDYLVHRRDTEEWRLILWLHRN